MATRDLLKLPRLGNRAEPRSGEAAPSSTRRETVQRLQVGLSGLAAMILLVGLANIIQDRARVTEEMAVPEAAPTVEPVAPPVQRDPLADAGVVPDLPAEPSPSATQPTAILPEQGNGDEAPTR